MIWLSNQSNLLKFGWYQVDENDKHIIDNNELSEKKIEKYQAEEARRREALEKGEPVPAFGGFEEGLGFEQIDAFDGSSNIIGNTNYDQEEMGEFSEGLTDSFDPEYGMGYEGNEAGFSDNPDFINENNLDAYNEGNFENLDGDPAMGQEMTDGIGNQGMQFSDEDIDPGMQQIEETVQEPEPPQINLEEIQAQIDEQIRMAEEQAKQIIDNANAQANEIAKNAETLKNQAIEEGRNAGYEEGKRKAEEEIDQMKAAAEAEIAEERKKQQADFQQLIASIEPDMVDTLTQIYEHVFNVDLRENKDIILHLIRTTLGKVESGSDIILHISSDDYDLVIDERATLDEAMASPNSTLEIIEDPLLNENECIIESDGGVFDCSLGVELSELSRKLKLLSFDRSKR
ncbi:FliH/SctL family protein [Butyrivibrio sp. WCE2006]|uniref:FliH/SctL family protein n=1 Tax=Butyrivibrio sp. WCE2006 TaxID=1410611 RepID=UPI0005D2BD4D|nr:FliH/SctL family protein [Butyrivibrio sp. WCE2006]